MDLTLAQNVFGISEFYTYLYTGIFIFISMIIIFWSWYLKKRNFLFYNRWFLFVVVFISIIFILPFSSLVNFEPFGINGNNSLWYKQILQISILIGNIFMILLVLFLMISIPIGIIRNIIVIIEQKNTIALFWKSFLWFTFLSLISLTLINLYRFLPIFDFDMSNDPLKSFTYGTNPVGLGSNFNNEGYWPFFVTNFLIKYFFTGNFNIKDNVNSNYEINPEALNQGIPIFAILVICIFSISFLIGIYLGWNATKNSKHIKKLNNIKKKTDKPLKFILAFLPVATFSFFSESLLRSISGTFVRLGIVFLILLLAWIIIFFMSGMSAILRLKLKIKTYFQEILRLLIDAFKKNDFEKSIYDLNAFIDKRVFEDNNLEKDKYTKNKVSEFYHFSYIAESVVFSLVMVGYLSFSPTNGYGATSNVNSAQYWILLYLGALFTMYGSYEVPGIAVVSQNSIASCALNVMGGVNAGIFAPFAITFNRFRVVLNLNYILLLTAFSTSRDFRRELAKENKKI